LNSGYAKESLEWAYKQIPDPWYPTLLMLQKQLKTFY